MALLLLLFISAQIIVSQSRVTSFWILVHNSPGSQSTDPLNMVLYWEDELINCTVTPSTIGTSYRCNKDGENSATPWHKYQSSCNHIGDKWLRISGGITDGIWIESVRVDYTNNDEDILMVWWKYFCTTLTFALQTPTFWACGDDQQSGLKDWEVFCLGKNCSTPAINTLYINLRYYHGQQALVTDIPPNITFQCTSNPTTNPSQSPSNTPSALSTKMPSLSPITSIAATDDPTPSGNSHMFLYISSANLLLTCDSQNTQK